jgi:4-amino-4-deoxy-L-arabinose transferase-like glycosyltransferase
MVGALVGSALLILGSADRKDGIEHDEGITFIHAAGKMADWMRVTAGSEPPAGTWAAASAWQSFWQPAGGFDFAAISQGLATWDIHPPLYFWLLHVWALVFGMTPLSSIWLNIALAVLTGFALFGLARWAFGDPLFAALAVCVWALSAPTVGVSVVARQYGLLALVSVLTVWAGLAWFGPTRRPRVLGVLGLGLLIGVGMLTYYQFALLVVGLMLWLTIGGWGRWRQLLALYASGLVGVLILVAAHPGFWTSLWVLDDPNSLGDPQWGLRVQRAAESAARLVSPELGRMVTEASPRVQVAALLAGVVAIALALLVGGWRPGAERRDADPSARRLLAIGLLGGWNLGLVVGLYLIARSPGHAMGDRYLAMALPFLAFLPLMLVRPGGFLRRGNTAAAFMVVVALSGASVYGQVRANLAPTADQRAASILAGARHVVIDSLARGVVPRILVDARRDLEAYADTDSRLLGNPAAWADRLQPGDVVVSDPTYADSRDARIQLRRELQKRFVITKLDAPAPMSWWRIDAVRS